LAILREKTQKKDNFFECVVNDVFCRGIRVHNRKKKIIFLNVLLMTCFAEESVFIAFCIVGLRLIMVPLKNADLNRG